MQFYVILCNVIQFNVKRYILLPVFTYILQLWTISNSLTQMQIQKEKTESLLRLIQKIIINSEEGFKNEFIDNIIHIFISYSQDSSLTIVCLDILHTLL